MKRILFGCIVLLCSYATQAQKDCHQEEYLNKIVADNPALLQKLQQQNTTANSRVNDNVAASVLADLPEVITIPVVVHVLYNADAQNILEAQINKQIEVLNTDFGGANADKIKVPSYFQSLVANVNIKFALAKVDPQGYATSGIVRKKTNIQTFSLDDRCKFSSIGGDDAWDANSYLNIWVCNLTILGYASVVGGPLEKDGVVINSSVFGVTGGVTGLGRTATHEIGHWLGLKHIWGDGYCGDDGVDDTPRQKFSNKGCPSGEKFSCGTTAHGDMYMNFMDLADDPCMLMFTQGQKNKMRSLFLKGAARNVLLSSTALTATPVAKPSSNPVTVVNTNNSNSVVAKFVAYPNPSVDFIQFQIDETQSLTGKNIGIYNQVGQRVLFIKATNNNIKLNISALQKGTYFAKVEDDAKMMVKFIKM